MKKSTEIVHELLETADIAINSDRPWDIQVHDERFYERVLRDASLGLDEAYYNQLDITLILSGTALFALMSNILKSHIIRITQEIIRLYN